VSRASGDLWDKTLRLGQLMDPEVYQNWRLFKISPHNRAIRAAPTFEAGEVDMGIN
jgi:hypothetical protein